MSFRIYAAGVIAGSRPFVYTRNNQPDGDIFEAAAVISALRAVSGPSGTVGRTMENVARGAVEAAADYVLPSEASLEREGIRGIARMVFLYTLNNMVTLLAMSSRAHQGWISVYTHQSRWLWADNVGFVSFGLGGRSEPGVEFIREVSPILSDTDMNNYGVLRTMSLALSEYHSRLDRTRPPMINIELFK